MLDSVIASLKSGRMSLDSMEDLFVMELQDLYDVEEQLIGALPKMEKAAVTPEFKQAIHEHLEVTKRQKMRLEDIFRQLNMEPKASRCEGIRGMIMEGEILMKAKGDPKVKDAALLAAAQRVEHYEMAAYGAARTYANLLGHPQIASLLQQTLEEEGNSDKRLTDVALHRVDPEATGRA